MNRTMNTARLIGLAASSAAVGCVALSLGCAQQVEPFERAAAFAGVDSVERYDNRPPVNTRDPNLKYGADLLFRVAVAPGDPAAIEAAKLAGKAPTTSDPFVWFPVVDQASWRSVGRELGFPQTNPAPRNDDRLGLVLAQDGHKVFVLLHNTLSRTFGPETYPGYAIDSAEVTYDIRARPSVAFAFEPTTGEAFSSWTAGHVGERVAAIVDGWVIVTPRVKTRMAGSGMLTGVFPLTDAEELARRLLATQAVEIDADAGN